MSPAVLASGSMTIHAGGRVRYKPMLEQLLSDSPVRRNSVIRDVRDFIDVGEYSLAFDTLCSWIYEDDLPITQSYYGRIVEASHELGSEALVERLKDLVTK